MCQRLLFNKVAGPKPATLLKKSLWDGCFPVNFAKFLRVPFLQNTSGRLLLCVIQRVSFIPDHINQADITHYKPWYRGNYLSNIFYKMFSSEKQILAEHIRATKAFVCVLMNLINLWFG